MLLTRINRVETSGNARMGRLGVRINMLVRCWTRDRLVTVEW